MGYGDRKYQIKEALIKAHYNRVCRGNQRQQAKDGAILGGQIARFPPPFRSKGRRNPGRGVRSRPPWPAYTGSRLQKAHVIG